MSETNIILVNMLFGSKLYGTATPDSDTDYKGVALPTWRQVATGRVSKHIENSSTGSSHSKNSAEDVDTEIYTLHGFVKLALEGQTVAFDMLHAPESMCSAIHPVWRSIQQNRDKFYSRNVNSFVGYAVGQAAKYGIKGSRLNDAASVLEWLKSQPASARIADCPLETFPTGEHIKRLPDSFEVCGKQLQFTVKVQYASGIIAKFHDNYGSRAKLASENQGVDWKAISHAFRAAYQMKQLFLEGTITFPRPEADLLRQIKTGQLNYVDLAPMLEDLIEEVRQLKDSSPLPERPDHKFWEDFLVDTVWTYLVPNKQ